MPAFQFRSSRRVFGPVHKAFAALDTKAQFTLSQELLDLISRFNVASDGTMVVPSDYLEVVLTRS